MIAKRRIAHVTTVHHPLDPRIYRKQIASLRRVPIETWFIARDAPNRAPDAQFLPLTDAKGPWARIRRHIQAFRHIRRLRPDVVHIHDPELIPLARLGRLFYGARVIYDMHENYLGRRRPGGRFLRFLERWSFHWVDHVVLAESSYEAILKGRATPSTVILNYVAPPDAELQPSADHPFTMIYAGTISNCRGLTHMLDLAAEIKRKGLPWKVKIVGVSHLRAEREAAESRLEREGLASVVECIGWDHFIPWTEITQHYVRADVGLALFDPLPNHTGSILSKFYEYIYFKLPTVYSNFPLWRAFFEGNRCGVAVDPSDPDVVLAAIAEMSRNDQRATFERAAERVRYDYVWSEMEPRLIGLYEDLFAHS